MEDDELQAIRARRLAELQAKSGSAQPSQVNKMRKTLIMQLLISIGRFPKCRRRFQRRCRKIKVKVIFP